MFWEKENEGDILTRPSGSSVTNIDLPVNWGNKNYSWDRLLSDLHVLSLDSINLNDFSKKCELRINYPDLFIFNNQTWD